MEVNLIFQKMQVEINAGLTALSSKSSNLSQEDMIMLAVIAAVGLLFCFFGLKMVRFWAAFLGLAIGVTGGSYVASYFNVSDNIAWIIGLVAGVILAVLGARFYLAGVFLVAWFLGTVASAYFMQPADWIYTLVCVGIGLVIGLITLKFAEPVTMVVTSLFGGFTAGQAIYGLIPLENEIVRIAAIAVLVILGVIVQFLLESKKRKRLHLKKAEEIRKKHSTANEVDKARAMMDNLDSVEPVNKKEAAAGAVALAKAADRGKDAQANSRAEDGEKILDEEEFLEDEEFLDDEEYLDEDDDGLDGEEDLDDDITILDLDDDK